MPKFHIWTVGCQMNKADSLKLAAGLQRLGFQESAKPEESDLVVVNTCSVRQGAEDRAYSKLGSLRKLKQTTRPDMKIAVMGCMVGLKTDDLERRFPYVDAFAQPQKFEPILDLLGFDDLGGEFWPETYFEPDSPAAFVPVIHGCDKFCTYCIVPYRRGREASRPLEEIRSEVAHLCARGVNEITLLGQTVEAYGHDLPEKTDLADLFESLHEIDGLKRIRFLTSYPKDMTDRIIRSVGELPKVCEYFNIPVQSGDEAVLERMRRGYTLSDYWSVIERIKKWVPDAAITTDLIVGFCGETEEEFQNSVNILEQIRFDKVHVAAYSVRPGTIAARKMEDDVPQAVKMERLHIVEALQEQIGTEINAKLLGTTQEVLVESRKEGKWMGRNRRNKIVHFIGPSKKGQLTDVEIQHTSPWSLQGIVSGTTAPELLPLISV
jgi:tRNA-2-methylthio-N6-dimethylallyladenosine synthase